ncbi:hypothetical protein Fot_16164 [Forsythia ovata]|uniref:Uncharacterized protein n=1 Tax=Forsythia ovata TaxID=205694 RepID=A0ABD1WB90_9LAMI
MDERTCHEEKLYKIMSDIRLRQDQIISQQNDLKREVRAIQGYVDDKISSFLEELKAKFDGEMRSEANPGQMVIYKSLKTGASSGLGDQQNFSDLLDDKFFTEDVMEQVEEIIKSAEKSKTPDTIECLWFCIRKLYISAYGCGEIAIYCCKSGAIMHIMRDYWFGQNYNIFFIISRVMGLSLKLGLLNVISLTH